MKEKSWAAFGRWAPFSGSGIYVHIENWGYLYSSSLVAQSESTRDARNGPFEGFHRNLSYYRITDPTPTIVPWTGTAFNEDYPYYIYENSDTSFKTGGSL